MGANLDLLLSSFLSYDTASKTLSVETESLSDAGTYNYAIYFELTDYPEVSASVPVTVQILRQPSSPISILPKPKSSYTLSPGSNLLLSFEISSP